VKFLLDTCLLSELIKAAPEPAVVKWLEQREDETLFVSAVTFAELQRGVERLAESRRRAELTTWLTQLEVTFSNRVLPFTLATARYWATMCAQAEAAGQSMAAFDSIIAASALEHGLALVTRNVRDFSQAPILLVNPWTDS
jgi:toxin FitB